MKESTMGERVLHEFEVVTRGGERCRSRIVEDASGEQLVDTRDDDEVGAPLWYRAAYPTAHLLPETLRLASENSRLLEALANQQAAVAKRDAQRESALARARAEGRLEGMRMGMAGALGLIRNRRVDMCSECRDEAVHALYKAIEKHDAAALRGWEGGEGS